MDTEELKERNFENEFIFSASRSSGPGGQNINKVNSKVELRFNVQNTTLLSPEEKEIITRKLKKKINKEGELVLVSQTQRTQLMNKKMVTEKFYDLISKALTLPVKRRPTRPTKASVVKRLERKHLVAGRKKLRNQPGDDSEA